MTTIRYEVSRDIPITHDVDVAVIGGGPGGIGAAVMAARAGAKTLLVERYGCLGGMATVGEVHPFMPNHVNGKTLDKPVYVDWVKAMAKYVDTGAEPVELDEVNGKARHISKDAAMLGAEDVCLEAGAQLLYHHWLADVIRDGDRIDAAVLLSKSGYTAVRAKQFIDCTGDGDLAALAGCEFEQGGPTGNCQPMTLCFKLSGVDKSRATTSRQEMTELYHQARERGEIDNPRENVLCFNWLDNDVVHFNTTRVVKHSGTDGLALSEAEIIARRQLRQMLAFFRKHVVGYENAQIHSIAHHIGVRETRRIKGRNFITRDDFDKASKFDDAIAKVHYPIDIHNPDGTGTEHANLPEGEWYEIPYGCIVAKDVENLLIGGRPISVDHAVHSSMRVMPPACSVGQAAGLAAAIACEQGMKPGELDGVEVRRELAARGADLA